jgi:hypothetical protein
MNINRQNALVAILVRIDKQIVESDQLMLKSVSGKERRLIANELAYLQIERLDVTAKIARLP